MSDLLQSASTWLGNTLKASVSQTVTYRRGNASITLIATIGETQFQVQNDNGFFEQYESRDYIFDAADLVFNSAVVEPQRGDQIDEIVGEGVETYEAMSPPSVPLFKYSDRYHTRIRLHTRRVD